MLDHTLTAAAERLHAADAWLRRRRRLRPLLALLLLSPAVILLKG